MLKVEQWANIKFCWCFGKFPSEPLRLLLYMYGDHSNGCSLILQWHYQFQMGRVSLRCAVWWSNN